MTVRVLIVDDSELVRDGLRMTLEAPGVEIVGEAAVIAKVGARDRIRAVLAAMRGR